MTLRLTHLTKNLTLPVPRLLTIPITRLLSTTTPARFDTPEVTQRKPKKRLSPEELEAIEHQNEYIDLDKLTEMDRAHLAAVGGIAAGTEVGFNPLKTVPKGEGRKMARR